MKEKVLRENKKWKITLVSSDDDCNLKVMVSSRGFTRYKLDVGRTIARLQEKRWLFFWSFWSTVETTNITSVVHEWVDDYFREEEMKQIWECGR